MVYEKGIIGTEKDKVEKLKAFCENKTCSMS